MGFDSADHDCCPPPAHWTLAFGGFPAGAACPCVDGPPDDGRDHPIPGGMTFSANGVTLGVTHWRRSPDGAIRLLFPAQVTPEGPARAHPD